jgi:hypothetical protein
MVRARPGLIQALSVVQFGPCTPISIRLRLISPFWPLSSSRNSAAAATVGVITGR